MTVLRAPHAAHLCNLRGQDPMTGPCGHMVPGSSMGRGSNWCEAKGPSECQQLQMHACAMHAYAMVFALGDIKRECKVQIHHQQWHMHGYSLEILRSVLRRGQPDCHEGSPCPIICCCHAHTSKSNTDTITWFSHDSLHPGSCQQRPSSCSPAHTHAA